MQFNNQAQPFASDNNPRAKKSRRWMFVGCVGIMCIILAIGGTGVYLLSEQERKETAEAYGTTIVNMCDPIRGGDASLDNLGDNVEYPLKVVVFQEGLNITHIWQDSLPDEWQANKEDEVDAVICIHETEPKLVEECPYGEGDDQATMRREQQRYDLIFFNPEGAKIAEVEALGGMPDECPDEIRAEDGDVQKETGADIEYSDFEDAIRPIVLGEE
jgi:hypothetical protein